MRNERMKVMKGKSGDRQKTVRLSLQRGLGPGLSVSAETSTLQMTGYTHKHTLAQLRQSSTETLASLLLKSLKPRGIEEKTQLCVFFNIRLSSFLPACRRLKEERWGDLCEKRKSKTYEIKESVKADALRVKELREGEEGDGMERNPMLKE